MPARYDEVLSEEDQQKLLAQGFVFESVLVWGKRDQRGDLVVVAVGSPDLLREGTLWVGVLQQRDSEKTIEFVEVEDAPSN